MMICASGIGSPAPKATPTPTPQPRKLSGGFGRVDPDAMVTPAVAETPTPGQPLADTVRAAEQARKRKGPKAAVTITNETLVTDPKKGRLTTSLPRPTSPAPAPGHEQLVPTPAGPDDSSAEAYWRERMHSARSRVEELRERIRRFEQESKKLENDFYSWDDGQYRDGVIKPAWDQKREELETARRDLEQAEKELSELPEKARKAGALPGWLRE
ncbi:MAG TPA: hypothetical protein VLU06_09970 [Thermoanaerobaculia bacterium]|nr:hypothetical protein [Thermoanaerobaculia bacterium]